MGVLITQTLYIVTNIIIMGIGEIGKYVTLSKNQ